MLELRSVLMKSGREALSCHFEAGQISVVLGRNHSGKTRLTRIIAGLERPLKGELLLHGVPVTDTTPGERSVALVYQAFVNYPNWTVFQNIASPLIARRQPRQEIGDRVAEIALKLELTPLLERLPGELSGGQQQRVAIGRALAKSARVLVMDEPLVNLDFKLRESLQLELRALLSEFDLAVVYTSTDPRDAFALADTVLLMLDHELVQTGTPLDVYENPLTQAAADLMSDPRTNGWKEAGVTHLLRPEHLYLKRERDDDLQFQVQVLGRETNGSETFLHCRSELSGAGHWVARLEGLIDAALNERLTLFAAAGSVLTMASADG